MENVYDFHVRFQCTKNVWNIVLHALHLKGILTCRGDTHIWQLHTCGGNYHVRWGYHTTHLWPPYSSTVATIQLTSGYHITHMWLPCILNLVTIQLKSGWEKAHMWLPYSCMVATCVSSKVDIQELCGSHM